MFSKSLNHRVEKGYPPGMMLKQAFKQNPGLEDLHQP